VPIPKHILELLALTLLEEGSSGAFHAGVALLVAFDTFARHGEMHLLRNKDVLLPGSPANFLEKEGTIYLRKTKSGVAQAVALDNHELNQILRMFMAGRDPNSNEALFEFGRGPRGGQRDLLWWLKWAQKAVGYVDIEFLVHGTRHGGATHAYMTKERTVLQIKLRGRWKSLVVCELYLQANQARLAAAHVPEAVASYLKPKREIRRFFGLRPSG